jgi:exosortase/archaeosortase family protein
VIGANLPGASEASEGSGAAVTRGRSVILARAVAGVAVLGLGAWLLACNGLVRGLEARVTVLLLRVVLGLPALPYRAANDVVFFQAGPDAWAGIEITSKCSVVVFLVPLAAATGGLLLAQRLAAWRVTAAGVAAGALMIGVNFVRILVIVAARCIGGQQGFELAHVELGTWLTIGGTAAAGFVFVRIGTGAGLWPLHTGGSSA